MNALYTKLLTKPLTTYPLGYRVGQLIIGLAIVSLVACGSVGIKPWERGSLALDEMQFGFSSIDDTIDDHMYFSKEASSGGRGFGGGGCGCN